MREQFRWLRIIEYVGDAQFIRDAMDNRSVKGRMMGREGCYIQEAFLGETPELLENGRQHKGQ